MSYFDIDSRNTETLRYNQELTRQRARQAVVDRERAARALAQEIVTARIERGYGFTVPRAMRLINLLDRQRGSATVWTRSRGPCAVGTTIYTAPIASEQDEATWAHEYSHATSPRCPGTGRHRRTVIDGAACCVQCEADAWAGALRLIPFSRPMFDELSRALNSYLRQIPAPAVAQREARRYTNGTAWRIAQHRQLETQIRLEQYREMQQWIV